jgi:hypothetical protein
MLFNFDLEHIAQHYEFPLTVLMKDELVNQLHHQFTIIYERKWDSLDVDENI